MDHGSLLLAGGRQRMDSITSGHCGWCRYGCVAVASGRVCGACFMFRLNGRLDTHASPKLARRVLRGGALIDGIDCRQGWGEEERGGVVEGLTAKIAGTGQLCAAASLRRS